LRVVLKDDAVKLAGGRRTNPTSVGFFLASLWGDQEAFLDKNYGLGTGNFKALATTNISANQKIINPDQIVARLLEASTVLLVSTLWWLWLPRAFQPTHIIVGTLTAMGTTVASLFYFLFFVEEISFVHNSLSLDLNI